LRKTGGQILVPGIYDIAGPTVLDLELILDGENDPNSEFIFKIGGAFSSYPNAKIKLINGALACNVFWKVEGMVSFATGTSFKGTIIANNAEIVMAVGDTLEGRAISIEGAITVSEFFGYLPTGCSSPVLSGPIAPNLGTAACFAIFTSEGVNTNVGITFITGDVGTNGASDLTTGYDPLLVSGEIHPIPDLITDEAATDLLVAYNYLVGLDPGDIELVRPDLFGHDLVLTPHTYLMLSAVTFTDTVYLDARGNEDAVFIINVNGALSTSVNSRVALINGAQAKNVYWKIDGAVTIADNSVFNGTIIAAGEINLHTGTLINGRALSITGALNIEAISAFIPTLCSPEITLEVSDQLVCLGDAVTFTVEATGVGLSYQWRKGLVDLVDDLRISGSETATLTIDPTEADDAASDYNVVVSGTYSPSVTSEDVELAFKDATAITLQPTNQSVCLGDEVTFQVTATGTGLSYQWRKGLVDLVDNASISGSETASLTIDPTTLLDAATNYNVLISSDCASDITSNNVELEFNTATLITLQPTSQSVCLGDEVTFQVTATGTGLSYQWRKGLVDLVDNASISGSETASLTIDPTTLLDAATNYNVLISSDCASDITSNSVELDLTEVPLALATSNSAVCEGDIILLSTTTVENASYSWVGPNGFISSDQNPILTNVVLADAGLYSLTINVFSCVSNTSVTSVEVNNCDTIDFFIPEGFSPNKDGINDLFVIRGIEFYPNNTFLVFNRWGNKVFESKSYLNTWDGTSNLGITVGTDELPVGTYFYILDLGDGSDVYKGTIYLNR
jgi:gliding motility-associated-like protein